MRRAQYASKSWCVLFFLLLFTTCVNAVINTTIPTVYVTSSNSSHTTSGGSKLILSHEEIIATGSSTLSQALQSLGGIQLQDMTSNSNQVLISLRGFGANASSNTLLLINGMPITNPDLAAPDLNIIPINAIQYIEVIAGSESVLYGDQAVGGVINVVTQDNSKEKYTLSCGTGSYNQYRCAFTVHENYKQLNTVTTLIKNYSANYRDHNRYQQNQLIGNLSYLFSAAKLEMDYNLANESMQFPGALTAKQVRQNRRQAQNNSNVFNDWNRFIHFKYSQPFNAFIQMTTDFAHRQMQGDGVLISPFTQGRITNFLRPQLKITLNRALILSGFDLKNDSYDLATDFGITKDKQQKYGLFSLAKLFLTSKMALAVGMRGAQQNTYLTTFDTNDNINRVFVTTIGLNYQTSPDTIIYLRRAGNFRFPKADEIAATLPGTNGLKTQRGISYETGFEINRANYSTKINWYQLALRDEIAFDPTQTPETPFGTNQNLPPTIRQGLSLSGKTLLTDILMLNTQLNLVKAHFQSGIYSGNRIPLVSECLFRTGLNYHFKNHWHFYSEALFTGNQFADNDNANIAKRTGGYTIFNFNIGYIHQNFDATFRINNLFNKNYYFYTVYQTDQDEEFFYPAPGRNINLTMNYHFL